MSKLSATMLISASLFAATNSEVETFLKNNLSKNPAISSLTVKVVERQPLEGMKGWDSFVVSLDAKVKQGKDEREVKQRVIYFANDKVITGELTDMKTGKSLRDAVAPKFKAEYYKKENLIYGNANAKHKVAIFSDPLCPFCRNYVPKAVEYMKQYPETFAVYYYHFPLERLHPAAPTLTRAAVAAELQGRKDVMLSLYKVPTTITREKDEQKILDAFNKAVNTNLKISDLHAAAVNAQVASDDAVIESLMVSGTPTVYFDGEKDATKNRYKGVNVK
ncbi:thioredoxin domain-containing protein [Sulfurimonas sp. HSL-3221]|nr:thioredoxin domain-containing protein [Sulfurimonas sp. HSL-3221]UFS63447.1 thioredoxin domain-containing protein [Sulfurimonas sp. HSL-3221]